MSALLDTDKMSERLRSKAIRRNTQEVLITNFRGSAQESDLTEPPNCGGFGRIRHFQRGTGENWPKNPLPIDPACQKLGISAGRGLNAQVFQNAACNWRCWYCFVPFDLLNANPRYASWLTAEQLIGHFIADGCPAQMIDLSGGQPELTPEWIPWTMTALEKAGLASKVFLWSDDNLSNDYFWRFLSPDEIAQVCAYPMYAKVCCFKGFDGESFSFNTKAEAPLFDRQFELFQRYLGLGIDLYAYATFTAPNTRDLASKMARFVDRLQTVHPNLPLRTVPLEIRTFSVVEARSVPERDVAMAAQTAAIEAWENELARRFTSEQRLLGIASVSLSGARRL